MPLVSLPGFTILGQLNMGKLTNVYRCRQTSDGVEVIVKVFDMLSTPNYKIQDIEYEYYLLKKMNQIKGNHTVKPIELIHNQFKIILVLENIDGILLSNYIKKNPLSIEDFFIIALQMTHVVELLHDSKIIHKDLNPSNFLIIPETKQLTLVNLENAEMFDSNEINNSSILKGKLDYISPEQTGRINRPVDYRTDFYSLGIIFYEMLSGKTPFHSEDSLEIIHDHIANAPPDLEKIPFMINSIVQKLLMKSPEDRYIHASSLIHDLRICEEQWLKDGRVTAFQLGMKDKKNVLQFSSKIYGLDKQIETLVQAFYQVTQNEKIFFLISGAGGSGKTTYVNELNRHLIDFDGYFVKGNYDQLQFKTPYSGIILAFNELIQKILLESEGKLLQIREDILSALGNNLSVIVEILPSLEHIVGKQLKPRELNFTEAQNRLIITFKNLVSVFLKHESSLIIFLDNLQWADSASWKLLEELLEDKYLKGLMIIGAYRDNEVDKHHPLIILKNKFSSKKFVHEVSLSPWGIESLTAFLKDTFLMSTDKVLPLAKVLLVKTKGNPFYVKNFLSSINREQLICFNNEDNEWNWDIVNIEQEHISDNVIDFLLKEMHNLTQTSQEILKFASCFGHTFTLNDLSKICNTDPQDILTNIEEILHFNFIIPKENAAKAVTLAFNLSTPKEDLQKLSFEFSHDRVQQAAFSSVPEAMKQEIHLSIGRILIQAKEPRSYDNRLFSIMDHINQSLTLIDDASERMLLAKYNLWAGLKAKSSVAQAAANNYFGSGLTLVQDENWESDYELIFSLHKGYIETLYYLNEFETANQLYAAIKNKIQTPLENVELSLIKIYAYVRTNQHEKALTECFRALSILNFTLAKKISKVRFFLEMILLRYRLGWSFNNLQDKMFPMTDPRDIAISTILDHLITISFLRGKVSLLSSVTCKTINFNLQKGYSKYTPYALITLATMYVAGLLDMKKGQKVMKLAEILQEKAYDPIIAATNNVLKGNFLIPWFLHGKEAVRCEQTAYLDCMELGEIEQAIYTTHAYSVSFEISTKLSDLIVSIESGIILTDRYNNYGWYYYLQFFKLMMNYLTGKISNDFNNNLEHYISEMLKEGNKTTYASACGYAVMFFYIMHDKEKMQTYTQLFHQHKLGVWGVMPDSMIGILFTAIAEIRTMKPINRALIIKKVSRLLKKFKHWSDICPENFSFTYFWLNAELTILKGQNENAMALYDEAISHALKYGYENFVAIIAESASEFYVANKRYISAKSYYELAYYYYQRWGAIAKCQQLEAKYPNLKANHDGLYGNEDASLSSVTSGSLDLESVMKASMIISGEVLLEQLLEKILSIVLENAGAQIGAFIFKEKEQLKLVAYAQDTTNTLVNLQEGILIDNYIPLSIVNYVDRTLKTLILDNEMDIGKFHQDEYIRLNHPKSILCLPIMNQGKRIGYLYLENRISERIFTNDRINVLKLLSGKIAISIENAKLYALLGRFVPYELLNELNKENITEAQLGDNAKKNMTILFCDIYQFTAMSENVDPEFIFKIINIFLGHLEPVIKEHNGFIDKYIGDAIMALFNSADNAVHAGLAILDAIPELNQKLVSQGFSPIKVGVGINSGTIMAGIVGSEKRLEVTVIGDAVNVASRLEGLTRTYHKNLLISDETKQLLSSDFFEFEEIANANIKGKEKLITIWAVRSK